MKWNRSVAVCMIAKNCGDIIDVSLRWALENFEEVNIVVDPSNDDDTIEVIAKHGGHAKILTHPFDNFSAQKNRAFDMATTPWILSVDSDEIYEYDIPWDRLTIGLDKTGKEVGAFHLYNIQKNLDHFKPPIETKPRLMRKDLATMDGKVVDEGLDFADKKMIIFPYAHIHFGHVRDTAALKLKGKDRLVFKDQDPCDGPGMAKYGDDWFIKRNEEWDRNIVMVPKEVKKSIERYYL